MFRVLVRIGVALSLAVIATALVAWWRQASSAERDVATLRQEKHELEQVVSRLSADNRVADVIVTDQTLDGGTVRTKLLFVEYDRAGRAMPSREFLIDGRQAHVDAEVIEFQRDFVMKGDPLRGHAVALFTRVYGDQQSPQSGATIDTPGDIPRFYRDADAKTSAEASAFEQKLWKQFWRLDADPDLRQQAGVRVAVGKGVWGPFEPGRLYTITLGADGNLSRRVEPIRGVYGAYIDMLKAKGPAPGG